MEEKPHGLEITSKVEILNTKEIVTSSISKLEGWIELKNERLIRS